MEDNLSIVRLILQLHPDEIQPAHQVADSYKTDYEALNKACISYCNLKLAHEMVQRVIGSVINNDEINEDIKQALETYQQAMRLMYDRYARTIEQGGCLEDKSRCAVAKALNEIANCMVNLGAPLEDDGELYVAIKTAAKGGEGRSR